MTFMTVREQIAARTCRRDRNGEFGACGFGDGYLMLLMAALAV